MLQCLPVNEERMSVLHQDLGGIGNPSPTALEISLDSWDFALEKFFGHRGWICQSSWWSAAPIQKTPFKLTTGKGGQSPAWEDLLTAELLLRHLWSEEAHHLTLATLFKTWPPCLKSGHPANYCRHQKSNAKAHRENLTFPSRSLFTVDKKAQIAAVGDKKVQPHEKKQWSKWSLHPTFSRSPNLQSPTHVTHLTNFSGYPACTRSLPNNAQTTSPPPPGNVPRWGSRKR